MVPYLQLVELMADTLLVRVGKAEKVEGMAEKAEKGTQGNLEGPVDRAEKVEGIHPKVVDFAE